MKAPILCLILACLVQKTWPTITWSGSSITDVVDENLVITGNCLLPNSNVYIVAEEADVTVTVTNKAIIQAQINAQQISLVAAWPYTITIKVEHDLEFRGVEGVETEPIYLYLFGDGEIRWEVRDDKKLRFNKTTTSGHTELWMALFNGQLRHVFKLSDKHQLFFGQECIINYAVFNTIPWTGAYEIQSTNYHQSSSKDYPRIVFDEDSQLSVQVIQIIP